MCRHIDTANALIAEYTDDILLHEDPRPVALAVIAALRQVTGAYGRQEPQLQACSLPHAEQAEACAS